MKTKYLYIKNFKNIKEVEIDFSKRINLITGDTGSGKSSILDAVKFILTDTLDEKLAEYIRKGTEKFNIHLIFEHEGIDYDYEVEVGKSTKKILIVEGEEFINSEATKKLAEVIDPIITKYSAISEQGKTAEILFQKPAERLKTLKDILKVDMLSDVADEIKEDIKALKEVISNATTEKTTLESRNYTYLPIPEEVNIESLKQDLNTLDELKIKYDQQQVVIEKHKNKKADYINAQTQIKELTDEKNSLLDLNDANSAALQKVPDYSSEKYDEVSKQFRDALIKHNSIQNAITQNQRMEIRNSKLKDEIVTLEGQANEIKLLRLPACEFKDEDYEDVITKLNEIVFKKKDLKEKIELVQQGKCPTCGQDFKTDVNELNKEYNRLEESEKEFSAQKIKIKSTIDEYNKIVEEQKDLRFKKQSILSSIEKYQQEIINNELNITVITEDTDFESIQDSFYKIEELKKKYEEVMKVNKIFQDQIDSVKNKVEVIDFKIDELNKIENPGELSVLEEIKYDSKIHDEVKGKLLVADQQNKNRLESIEFNNKIKFEEQSNKKRIDEIETLIESNKSKQSILDETANIINKDFSSYLISKGAESIKYNMNKFFQKAYDKYTVTMEQDKNSINFFYSVDEASMSPCSMASGHEKSVLGVANRVALCKLSDLGLFIGDEMDSFSSESKSQNLINSVIDEDIFENIFIVSHCEDTKEMIALRDDADVFEVKDGELV